MSHQNHGDGGGLTDAERQERMQSIVSVVRALITSRKPPCRLRDIVREYPDVECEPFPHRALGYSTPEDLLRDSGEFIFKNIGADVCISAQINAKSAHIAALVRSQKASSFKPRRGGTPAVSHAAMRRPAVGAWSRSSFAAAQSRQSQQRQPQPPPNNDYAYGDGIYGGGGGGGGQVAGDRNNNNAQSNNLNDKQSAAARAEGSGNEQNEQPDWDDRGGYVKDLRDILNAKRREGGAGGNGVNTKLYCDRVEPPHKMNGNGVVYSRENSNNSSNSEPPVDNLLILQDHLKQILPRPILGQNSNGQLTSGTIEALTNKMQIDIAMQQKHKPQSQHGQKTQYSSGGGGSQMNRTPSKLSVQERLNKIHKSSSSASKEKTVKDEQHANGESAVKEVAAVSASPPSKKTSPVNTEPFQFNATLDPILSLREYAQYKGFSEPAYNVFRSRFSMAFQCRVQVNGKIFSTYPSEFQTEHMSRINCAKKAIEQIQYDETRRLLPPCTDGDEELIEKLYAELLTHPAGVFAKNIPDWFETTYAHTLPQHWWSLVQSCNRFKLETTPLNKSVIIFACTGDNGDGDGGGGGNENKPNIADSSDAQSQTVVAAAAAAAGVSDDSVANDEMTNSADTRMELLKLPWHEKHWGLYITHCVSTVEIWARLTHESEVESFANLVQEIGAYMEQGGKARPLAINCKSVYLVYASDSWHRVHAVEVDKAHALALCFFIDFGDADWIEVNRLYVCEAHFLRVPAQAIRLKLFGLEDLHGNPKARKHLDEMLLNKSFVGEMISKESDYTLGRESVIEVVLYDTSAENEDNMLLNSLLQDSVCNDVVPPQLKLDGITNAVVTCINDDGDIYLQIVNADLKYVQKLMQQLIASKFKRAQQQTTRNELVCGNLYLVCVENESGVSQWYRGKLTDAPMNRFAQENFEMLLVDYGLTRQVQMAQIYRLDSLSLALSKYPSQAIRTRLHNIPDISSNILGRMRALLPINCEAMVKVATHNGVVPTIIVYRRLQGNDVGSLCTVNDVIRVEHELEMMSINDSSFGSAAGSVDSSGYGAKQSPTVANKYDTLDRFNFTPAVLGGDGGAEAAPAMAWSEPKMSNSLLGSPIDGAQSPRVSTTVAFSDVLSSSSNSSLVDMTRSMHISSVPNSPKKSDVLPKLKEYEAIPFNADFFEVRVSMVANPGSFTIQSYKDYPRLRTLMKQLQEYCENNDDFIPADMVEIGQAYAAKNNDGFYNRVIVANKLKYDMIHVCFCDFGDVEIVRSDRLKLLPAKFRQLPKMAILAKMHGICSRHMEWTLEDCLRFRDLTLGRKFMSTIKKVSMEARGDNNYDRILELELIDVTTEEDIYIRDVLIKENHAMLVKSGN